MKRKERQDQNSAQPPALPPTTKKLVKITHFFHKRPEIQATLTNNVTTSCSSRSLTAEPLTAKENNNNNNNNVMTSSKEIEEDSSNATTNSVTTHQCGGGGPLPLMAADWMRAVGDSEMQKPYYKQVNHGVFHSVFWKTK